MNAHIKDYGPSIVTSIWITAAVIHGGFFAWASAGMIALLSLSLWLEWHGDIFK